MALENYGPGVTGVVNNAGAPVAGTNEVQTATFGGTWLNTEKFRLVYEGEVSDEITWTATDATLLSRINTALDAMTTLGTSWVVASAGTVSSGLGTVLLTFSGGDTAKRNVNLITVSGNTSVDGTLAIATTTPGVTATRRDTVPGSLLLDVTNKFLYIDTGTQGAPTWTKVGSQS